MTTAAPLAGRGAFPSAGGGGTLKPGPDGKTTIPGGFYMLASTGVLAPGLLGFRALRDGQAPDVNTLAVHYGVKALQSELNRQLDKGMTGQLAVDGILGRGVDAALREFQTSKGLKADGIAGPSTCRALFTDTVQRVYASHSAPTRIGLGLVSLESGFDPAAVGRQDAEDLGLCQINGRAHPELSAEFRLTPLAAIAWQADFVAYLLAGMGNERDGVAAYNLGLYGARAWVKLGRPDPYTPPGSTVPRSVVSYVDKVLAVGA